MQQGSLLPYLHEAERYVEQVLGKHGDELTALARAIVSYDMAMLAYDCRPKVSMHCVAMTAAELLCLAARLEREGGGPAQEVDPPAAPASRRELERDADALGALLKQLTQADVARALAHFRQAAAARGIDVVASLALELKGERVKALARHHDALAA